MMKYLILYYFRIFEGDIIGVLVLTPYLNLKKVSRPDHKFYVHNFLSYTLDIQVHYFAGSFPTLTSLALSTCLGTVYKECCAHKV